MSSLKKFELYLKVRLTELEKQMESLNLQILEEAEAAHAELNYIFVKILPELKSEFAQLRNS